MHAICFLMFTFVLLVIIIAAVMINEFKKDETLVPLLVLLAVEIGQAIQLPICIGLTLRVAMRKKKTTPVIPQEPVFHDDPYIKPSEVDENIELGSVSAPRLQETMDEPTGVAGHAKVIQVQPCEGEISHHL